MNNKRKSAPKQETYGLPIIRSDKYKNKETAKKAEQPEILEEPKDNNEE